MEGKSGIHLFILHFMAKLHVKVVCSAPNIKNVPKDLGLEITIHNSVHCFHYLINHGDAVYTEPMVQVLCSLCIRVVQNTK